MFCSTLVADITTGDKFNPVAELSSAQLLFVKLYMLRIAKGIIFFEFIVLLLFG